MKDTFLEAAVIAAQGLRPEMEDTHFLDRDFAGQGWLFAGIYDGHGGKQAAEYATARLHLLFKERLLSGDSPQAAFLKSYETVSEQLSHQGSGATAVNLFIKDGIIYTANAGDARAIIISRENVRQLTEDHRADNPGEKERILQAGGQIQYPYIYRDGRGLMPTRTIGDRFFKAVGVIATPAVSEYRITAGDFILLAACDGLFDFMSNREVAEFALQYPQPQPLLTALRDEVLVNRRGTDNLTMIAVAVTP